MIYKPMDDTDIEEKLLLNALNNPHQALNLPMTYDNYARNNYYNNHYDNNKHHRRKSSYPKYYGETNKYSADRRDQQYDPFWQQNNSTRTSETVSMTTEESLFDEFDLDFEKPEQENNHHQGNNNARSESTIHRDLPRSISMEEDNAVTAPIKVTPPRRKSNTPKNGGNTPYRVEVPTNSDILCGQSRVCASHPGNRTFQNVLDRFAHQYDNATSKQEKMCMTKEVVRIIQIDNGGRFLKFKDGMWEEISIVAARDKVSHALRTKVASWKRQKAQLLKQSENGAANSNGKRRLSTNSTKSQRRRLSDTSENHANDDDQTFEPISLERAESETIVNGLMATQQQIFANLTALPRSNRSSSIHHPPVQPTPMYDNSFLNNTMHPSRSTPQF